MKSGLRVLDLRDGMGLREAGFKRGYGRRCEDFPNVPDALSY